jgi:hypothetical protein
MYAHPLCDWTTINGTNATSPVTQGESEWADLEEYQDCVLWVDVRAVTGTVTLQIETAPTKDDASFTSMVAPITVAAAATPTVYPALVESAAVPLARWVRWKLISSSTSWAVTMRIIASVNAPGG